MHQLLSRLLASACIAMAFGASAQTATPIQPTVQPAVQPTPSVANTDKAPSAEPGKPSKKAKKKKLKKKKARHAKAQ
jgi:hypothetical protein